MPPAVPAVQVLHARSCSGTAAALAAFFAVAHLIFSYGYDSVADAIQALKEPPPKERYFTDLLPGHNPFVSKSRRVFPLELSCVPPWVLRVCEGGTAPIRRDLQFLYATSSSCARLF